MLCNKIAGGILKVKYTVLISPRREIPNTMIIFDIKISITVGVRQ